MYSQSAVSKGLALLFAGQIIGLFTIIPFGSGILPRVSFSVTIIGFYALSKVNHDYNNAFALVIANLVIGILMLIFSSGFLNDVLSIVSTIIDFLVVYLVCNTTAGYLSGVNERLVSRAGFIWRMYLICMIVILACTVLAMIPFMYLIAGVIIVITAIVQLVASILYIIFLYQSQKALA